MPYLEFGRATWLNWFHDPIAVAVTIEIVRVLAKLAVNDGIVCASCCAFIGSIQNVDASIEVDIASVVVPAAWSVADRHVPLEASVWWWWERCGDSYDRVVISNRGPRDALCGRASVGVFVRWI